MIEINRALGYISNEKIWGFPLDFIFHFLCGAAITIVLLGYFKIKFLKACGILLVIAILKEIYDSTGLNRSLLESISDIVNTFIYPAILYAIRAIKRKAKD